MGIVPRRCNGTRYGVAFRKKKREVSGRAYTEEVYDNKPAASREQEGIATAARRERNLYIFGSARRV